MAIALWPSICDCHNNRLVIAKGLQSVQRAMAVTSDVAATEGCMAIAIRISSRAGQARVNRKSLLKWYDSDLFNINSLAFTQKGCFVLLATLSYALEWGWTGSHTSHMQEQKQKVIINISCVCYSLTNDSAVCADIEGWIQHLCGFLATRCCITLYCDSLPLTWTRLLGMEE